jgi:hypothetical protein
MVFFKGLICFFNIAGDLLDHSESLCILKAMVCRKYSFEKQTEFSQENNVLDASASNTNGFLWRAIFVSSTQLCRHI